MCHDRRLPTPAAGGVMPDEPLPFGKLPTALLTEILATAAHGDPAVRLGPAVGEDAAGIDVPAGTIVAATDPITLTGAAAGRFAVLVNANDVAVTGATPRWFLVAALLPPGTTAAAVRRLADEVAAALDEVGATLVGGHTEVTGAVNQPVLVGQMLGLTGPRGLVRSSGAAPGDVLVQIGPAPVEGAAVLAAAGDPRLSRLAADLLDAAAAAAVDPGISVVTPALAATDLGTSAMHDPTEGGLAAGLHELARASGVGLRVDPDAVCWFAPGVALCAALGADPWATLASGCLLATFPPDRADTALETLGSGGTAVARLGEVVAEEGVRAGATELPWPDRDEVARLADTD